LAIGFEGRLAARREAPFHVQLELATLPAKLLMPSVVQIEGRVVRVFRGDALIEPGASVSFALWVSQKGDEPTGPAYVYYNHLVAASHMEAYLYGTPPHCRLAAYEFMLLDRPSLDARMSVQELEDLMEPLPGESGPRRKTKRWWQIWRR
jgi:hypothetical protein